jgi:hypothetical protein
MSQLPALICPFCHRSIAGIECPGQVSPARRFDDCLRRCERCGIGASNTADSKAVTFICRDPLWNIPIESREGASEALANALNVRNRESKQSRFGFSTSEDAVTWVVFRYLFRSGQLLTALQRAGILTDYTSTLTPTLLLWGVPIGKSDRGAEIRRRLKDLCTSLKEDPNSFSEPDVIVDLGENALILIEVKYLSRNEQKPQDYRGWSRYGSASQPGWRFDAVRASGCYELARNWCLLKGLAGNRPATLANLGPKRLFLGANGKRLDRFIRALGIDERSQFLKATWSDLLGNSAGDLPEWFVKFCRGRGLL